MKFPFLEPFLQEKSGTLYFLSDPHVRMRDPLAAMHLARFFSSKDVDLQIHGALAGRRRLLDDDDILLSLPKGSKGRKEAERLLRKRGASFEERIHGLFRVAEDEASQQVKAAPDTHLAARGPICILGRPQMYPESLREQIKAEFGEGRVPLLDKGRFRLLSNDPTNTTLFRTFVDAYSGVTIPVEPFRSGAGMLHADGDQDRFLDYAVIRMVEGPYKNRVFVFAYGTSALGTLAAAQAMIDPAKNEVFNNLGVQEAFEKHRTVEILLRAERRSAISLPWTRDFEPNEITVIGPPIEPTSQETSDWVDWFTRAKVGDVHDELYERVDSDDHGVRVFRVIGYHPKPIGQCPIRMWQLVGGKKIRGVAADLVEHAQSLADNAVLLVGPTGVGKEIAARIIFEERVFAILRRLAANTLPFRPTTIGARYVALNVATLVETLAEAQLFGIRDGFVHKLGSPGALLDAGEGVVLLDELEAMALDRQAKLLRVVQPPYAVSPLGTSSQLPCNAAIVAAANEEPETLVSKGRLRADLYARLHPRTIRVPALKDRPADIPALLAHVAEVPIRFDERVLRCLLADPHHYNVRGLYEIVGRARQRQNHVGASMPRQTLHIEFDDLNPDVRDAFKDVIKESENRNPERAWPVFQFEAIPSSTAAQMLFEEAATILTSVVVGEEQNMRVRAPSPEFRKNWRQNADRATAKPAEMGARWLDLVKQTVEYCGEVRPEPKGAEQLTAILTMYGEMFRAACPRERIRSQVFQKWAADAYKNEKRRGKLKQKQYALSISMPEPRFSELVRTKDVDAQDAGGAAKASTAPGNRSPASK